MVQRRIKSQLRVRMSRKRFLPARKIRGRHLIIASALHDEYRNFQFRRHGRGIIALANQESTTPAPSRPEASHPFPASSPDFQSFSLLLPSGESAFRFAPHSTRPNSPDNEAARSRVSPSDVYCLPELRFRQSANPRRRFVARARLACRSITEFTETRSDTLNGERFSSRWNSLLRCAGIF